MAVNVNAQAPDPIYRGEDVTITFSPLASGQSDMTGWVVAYTLQLNGTTALQLLSTGAQVVVTGGASSTVAVTLTRAQTSALSAVSYLWDLWRVNVSGSYERLAGGVQKLLDPQYPPA